MDIIIYTTPPVLEHKQGKKKGEEDFEEFYWQMHKRCDVDVGDKIYFATKGFIRGYFTITDIEGGEDCDEWNINWFANSWKDIEPMPQKPFQGFKYFKGDTK